MIFGINTTRDTSKLSQISLPHRLVKLRITILKYYSWCLCQISLQKWIMLLLQSSSYRGSTVRRKNHKQLLPVWNRVKNLNFHYAYLRLHLVICQGISFLVRFSPVDIYCNSSLIATSCMKALYPRRWNCTCLLYLNFTKLA